jgi:hypothetical protein
MHTAYRFFQEDSWNSRTRLFLWWTFLFCQFGGMTWDERIHPFSRGFKLPHFAAIVLDIDACYCCNFLSLLLNPSEDIRVGLCVNRQMTTSWFWRIQYICQSWSNPTTRAITDAQQKSNRDFSFVFRTSPMNKITIWWAPNCNSQNSAFCYE